jgi:integral membrane protein
MPMLRLLRISSFLEGISFIVLVLIAMPLKYVFHIPEAVTYVGWAHGILFMGLYGLLFLGLNLGVITFKMAALTAFAALLPAAPFFLDRRYRELERHTSSSKD